MKPAISNGKDRMTIRSVFCGLLLLSMTAAANAAKPDLPIQFDALNRLAAAGDYAALKSAYRHIKYTDSVVRLAYALRCGELRPGKDSERLLIEAMPKSREELYRFCGLARPDSQATPFARYAAGGLFEAMAKAVVAQRKGHVEFLRLSSMADGELKVQLDGWTCFVRRADPKAYGKALGHLSEAERRYLPDDCDGPKARRAD